MNGRNVKLVVETVVVFILSSSLASLMINGIANKFIQTTLHASLLLFQGFRCYRLFATTVHKSVVSRMPLRRRT